MKVCSRCKMEKKLTEYSKCRSSSDGLNHRCDECNRLVANDHYERNNGTKKERKRKHTAFLDYIKSLRQQKWTLKDIAEATGLDESSISYYLSGKRQVGTKAVKKFEERLGVEI